MMLLGPQTFVPLAWLCKKQGVFSHSTTEAETISLEPVAASMSSPCMPILSRHSVSQIRRCSVNRACHELFGSVLLGKSLLVTFRHGSDSISFLISSQLYGLSLRLQPHCGWNTQLPCPASKPLTRASYAASSQQSRIVFIELRTHTHSQQTARASLLSR